MGLQEPKDPLSECEELLIQNEVLKDTLDVDKMLY